MLRLDRKKRTAPLRPADWITAGRGVLALLLLFPRPLSAEFYGIYTLAGLSDMADGAVARRTGTQSEAGARLDSGADLMLLCAPPSGCCPDCGVRSRSGCGPAAFWRPCSVAEPIGWAGGGTGPLRRPIPYAIRSRVWHCLPSRTVWQCSRREKRWRSPADWRSFRRQRSFGSPGKERSPTPNSGELGSCISPTGLRLRSRIRWQKF